MKNIIINLGVLALIIVVIILLRLYINISISEKYELDYALVKTSKYLTAEQKENQLTEMKFKAQKLKRQKFYIALLIVISIVSISVLILYICKYSKK